jgi:hypothetical protein
VNDEEAGGGGAEEVDEGGGVRPRVKKIIGQDVQCKVGRGARKRTGV